MPKALQGIMALNKKGLIQRSSCVKGMLKINPKLPKNIICAKNQRQVGCLSHTIMYSNTKGTFRKFH